MNLATVLHHQAIRLAEEADMAKAKYSELDFRELYARAAQFEKEAALLQTSQENTPLPRFTLLRSAAAFAYKAEQFSEAEKLIALCRAENPPAYEQEKLTEIESLLHKAAIGQPHRFQITGTFMAFDSEEQEIKIRDARTRQVFSVIVPLPLFRQVVKSYLLESVSAIGKSSSTGILTLEKIQSAA